jgi:hypothetical protein
MWQNRALAGLIFGWDMTPKEKGSVAKLVEKVKRRQDPAS